jgi:hypothetical protein
VADKVKWLRQRFKAMDAAGRVGHAARHISKSSSNAREGQSNCQASHETKKDAQFQDSHYLASCSKWAPRDTPRQSYSIPLNLQTQSRCACHFSH